MTVSLSWSKNLVFRAKARTCVKTIKNDPISVNSRVSTDLYQRVIIHREKPVMAFGLFWPPTPSDVIKHGFDQKPGGRRFSKETIIYGLESLFL